MHHPPTPPVPGHPPPEHAADGRTQINHRNLETGTSRRHPTSKAGDCLRLWRQIPRRTAPGAPQGTLDMLSSDPAVGAPARPRYRPGHPRASDDLLKVETGSLYPALHRLVKRGWLKAEWGVSEANQRARYYRLTAAGKAQLSRERDRWSPRTSRWNAPRRSSAASAPPSSRYSPITKTFRSLNQPVHPLLSDTSAIGGARACAAPADGARRRSTRTSAIQPVIIPGAKDVEQVAAKDDSGERLILF